MHGPVSIVTPSLNQGKFLERSVRSVLEQRGVAVEYFIADGGSSDGSPDILRRYQDRLRWISEPDGGQSSAVNRALRATNGEVIGWLNSDDVYYPDALLRAVEAFQVEQDIDVVYGRANWIDESDAVIAEYPTEPWDFKRLMETCFICQPAVFFRRRVLRRFGLLDESLQYCMDYEYWLRLARGGARFAHIDDVLAGSRLHAETKTVSRRLEVHREICGMFRERFGLVPGAWLLGYGKAAAAAAGLTPDRPVGYAARTIWASLKAAMHYNGRPDRQWVSAVSGWVRKHAPVAIRRERK
ncbi:MAG: glycosyltransferase family 2 protein [Planctomycetota bacterium]